MPICWGSPRPRTRAIALIFARIVDRISLVDQRDRTVVLEIVRVGVAYPARIEAHEGEMGEEQVGAIALPDVELDPVIAVAVGEVVALLGARPAATIGNSGVILPRPAAVPQARRHGMCG